MIRIGLGIIRFYVKYNSLIILFYAWLALISSGKVFRFLVLEKKNLTHFDSASFIMHASLEIKDENHALGSFV